MSDANAGHVRLSIADGIAAVVFDRPDAHNAMTWTMYAELGQICERLASDRSVRVATFRGAGGRAFVAGTDIEQFKAFTGGDDGIAYERRIDAGIAQVEKLPMPTLAICEGWVIGGGLAIAAACDLRIATPSVRFGVPIAKTLGNCLSAANIARIVAGVGMAHAKRMLLLAHALTAAEGVASGFVSEVVEAAELDATAAKLCARLASHAPLTMLAAKETIRRVVAAGLPGCDDLIRLCYGSHDFHEGVDAFIAKRPPVWSDDAQSAALP